MVSFSTTGPLTHLEFIPIHSVRNRSNFICFHMAIQLQHPSPPWHIFKSPLSPTDLICHLYRMANFHVHLSLFIHVLFCLIVLFRHQYYAILLYRFVIGFSICRRGSPHWSFFFFKVFLSMRAHLCPQNLY